MPSFKDLTGGKFGRLTVIDRAPNIGKHVAWFCACECGNRKIIRGDGLMSGAVVSCGCFHDQVAGGRNTRHNGCYSRLYRIWHGMKARCYQRSNNRFQHYGGRGIRVCDEWLHDFEAFRSWALANGYDENAPRGQCTLDRIDVNGNYEPGNCRWADMKVQRSNRRDRKERMD